MTQDKRFLHALLAGFAAAILTLVPGCAGGGAEHPGAEPADSVEEPVAETVVVPGGSVLVIEFDDTVSSADALPGDSFTATVIEPVMVGDRTAIPAGSKVIGSVAAAQKSKKIGGTAKLDLEFRAIQLAGADSIPISASFHEEARGSKKKDAATIGGAAAGGALVGRVIGHDRGNEADGTTIGAIVGGAIGTAIAATNEREEVTIPQGVVLYIELGHDVEIAGNA